MATRTLYDEKVDRLAGELVTWMSGALVMVGFEDANATPFTREDRFARAVSHALAAAQQERGWEWSTVTFRRKRDYVARLAAWLPARPARTLEIVISEIIPAQVFVTVIREDPGVESSELPGGPSR